MHSWPSVLHRHTAVKSVVFQVTYSHSVKSSVLGDIGSLTLSGVPPPQFTCREPLLCLHLLPHLHVFFTFKMDTLNIPYSLVFKWDFTAHRVQVLVSSWTCLDMWAVSMSPVLLNVFWFVLWCLSLAQVHPPCSTSHLLRIELVPQGFTIS